MQFTIHSKDKNSSARTGSVQTDHGVINTPIFMPVGTAGTVKAVHQHELVKDIKAEIILGNTYHLFIRPGMEIMKNSGGLHKFMHWDKPILTDSGGYQVYSLAAKRKILEEGVKFQSHIDGTRYMFTPENVMDVQREIGADIIMAFDECTPYPCEYAYASKSLDITHRWLKRCKDHFNSSKPLYGHEQALFPIVQGSVYKDLREKSADYIASMDLPGNAIGGLSVGEPHEMMYEMTEVVCDILPVEKPRYLMGVGTPANILECIALGVDMFDCVMPTRNARNGMLFTWEGIINIKNEKWKDDHSPIDLGMGDGVSAFYSKAYLRHLIISKEILGAQIASIHNLKFYLQLVTEARNQIEQGNFYSWKNGMVRKLSDKL